MFRQLKSKAKTFSRLGSLIKNITLQNRIDLLNYSALNNREPGITAERYLEGQDIVVSLTTYDKRLKQVYLTIESIMQQSVKPNRIILWLDYSFKNKKLPQFLIKQMNRGLEVKFCEDLKSYKKLIPALVEYPSDAIITMDDDTFYNPNIIENLVSEAHLGQYVFFNRGHYMKMRQNNLTPYLKWETNTQNTSPSRHSFPTGIGGVLYLPNTFSPEVLNDSIFMNICPKADDVWFKAMSLYNGVLSKKVETFNVRGIDYIENESVQDIALFKTNKNQGENDKQIKAVFDKYDLYSRLIKE